MIYEHTVYVCELERTRSLSPCAAVWLEGDVIRTLKHLIHCDVEKLVYRKDKLLSSQNLCL